MKSAQLKSHLLTSSLIIIITLILAGCISAAAGPAPAPTAAPQATLLISGAGGTSAILKYLAEAYRQQYNDLAFEFLSGAGSSGGVKGVLAGQLDLGTMSRPPKDSELADGIAYLRFGTEKIVVATSADLSITDLTSQQVKDIFLGKIKNWAEVGGPDTAISVLVRDEEETNTKILRQEIFGQAAFVTGAVVFTREGDLKAALASTPHAIAYLAYGGVRLEKLAVHPLVIDGQDPADLNGGYPYVRPAGVAYLPANAAKVQPFLDFITGPEAGTLLAEQGITLDK
jgi:phosphate transport system substrate-binding protein